jgi:hypothetical protein
VRAFVQGLSLSVVHTHAAWGRKDHEKSRLSCSLVRFFFLCGSFISLMWGLTSKDPIEWWAAHLVSVHRVVARKLHIEDHFVHKPVTRISYCTIGVEWW